MTKQFDAIWINGIIVTGERNEPSRSPNGIAIKNDRISWLGQIEELPGSPAMLAEKIYDLQGRCVTPGLIDCHTHLIFASNRAHEFERRLQGMRYEEIIRQGGGIQSTVNATRAASEEALFQQSAIRLQALINSGATTVEIKSGYGLDWPTELKILRVAQKMQAAFPITIQKTFLGAHVIPREYQHKPDAYVDMICQEMIPKIVEEKLADAIDVFCEKIAFNLTQTEKIFKAAHQFKLPVKCHAEQLSYSGSAKLAAQYGALSVDHLEHANLESIQAMANSGTVAVLLPGAFYFLRETQQPPLAWLREYQIPIALASDCNPGTSPIMSLPLILNMACTLFRMTPAEALQGVTRYAAKALGMENRRGTLAVGKAADFAIWDVADPVEFIYYMGNNFLYQLVKDGKIIVNIQSR